MPKEPRRVPTVLGRVQNGPVARPSGSVCFSKSEPELLYQRRALIEVAVPHPLWPHHKVNDPRPAKPRRAIRPRTKINLLVSLQLRPAQLFSGPFVLHGLLSSPAEDKRARRSRNQVCVFAGALDGIEDNLKIFRGGKSHQRRLRRLRRTGARKHAEL